jgi:hypothetical protein
MPTQTSSPSSQDSQHELEDCARDREIFSQQTLVLTALTAINNPNKHPTFKHSQVSQERLQFMKEKASPTPIIDAATTILVTNTEILATMANGANSSHGIVALTEIEKGEELLEGPRRKIVDLAKSKFKDGIESTLFLRDLDGHLPDEFYPLPVNEDSVPDEDIFVSFPNIDKALAVPLPKPTSSPICKPIDLGNGRWAQIMKGKTGFIFESSK